MVAKRLIQNKSKEEEYDSDSDSESEITYDYNDDDDDDDSSDDSDMEDSEDEEQETSQALRSKKRKSPKVVRFAKPPDGDADNDSNDAGDEGENEEDDDDDGSDKLEQPKKKKQKLLSNPENAEDSDDTDDDNDDSENESDDDDSENESDDDGEEDEKKEGEEDEKKEGEEEKAQSGFANVLSNILGKKTVSSKKVILAQGKTDREIRKLKESKLPPEEQASEQILTVQELEEKKLKRKLWLEMGKMKPQTLEKHYEKELKTIATRGVVQLFNAVKKQQKLMNENLSGTSTERKKDMIIESMNKKSFISLLQNTKVDVSIGSTEKETIQAKEPERKMWSVLKDDFVIGTGNMKDWDKQQDVDML